ncbi:hypothetical protein [Arsenicibacter rosenii]|uniref:Uncharacterized protein n=1 Tax=Arsenicibacter rosenii TaxID=1750698 RepID=A0A1S2VMG5_9BACT|nr:hypothetical protein [Arsenicibacter rosenii]OIN59962.1 hypothetical protein BLX24_08995 [Arsenicibacter rosenii]
MEKKIDFLAPKLEGIRFEDHTLPVNLLEDFSALEELIFEVAKQIFLEENPNRKRVPKGFTDNVSLKLSGIEEGSTIPKFVLVTILNSMLLLDANPNSMTYIEKARDRIIDTISNAKQGNLSSNLLGQKYLNFFNRIGKNLQEGESIDFSLDHSGKATLDKNVRKKLLLSRNERFEYSDSISINASVSAIDKKHNTFTLNIQDQTIPCKIDTAFDFIETITQAFNEYEKGALVSIKATGIYNEQDKLINIDAFESMDILDPYDVKVRLNQLSEIKDNWYEGSGVAPGVEFLKKFGEYFASYYNLSLPLPAIFPTLEGNIQLEWNLPKAKVLLEVYRNGFYSELLLSNDEDLFEEVNLNLDDQNDWIKLNNIINISM